MRNSCCSLVLWGFGRDSRNYAHGGACRLYEVGGSHLQLQATFARAHVDERVLHRGFVNENREVLLEAERAATAADVAGKRGEILERDGIDFFVAAHLGSSLQIHFEVPGHDAHEITDLVAVNENGLENLVDVFAEAVGYVLCTEVVLVDLVGDKFVTDFLAVQNTRCVCLFNFHML